MSDQRAETVDHATEIERASGSAVVLAISNIDDNMSQKPLYESRKRAYEIGKNSTHSKSVQFSRRATAPDRRVSRQPHIDGKLKGTKEYRLT
ncbi:hypothetical protein [Burkholderia reimsis]|uniref:hypothetical protein n=1 Tax=Burkholderia reimsis TaxID=2234132 RepID=UPI0014032910|nr:hypothetical protein [Burkholderia reimsis]